MSTPHLVGGSIFGGMCQPWIFFVCEKTRGLGWTKTHVCCLQVCLLKLGATTANEFSASGDLRNVIKSITGLPPTFPKLCEVFLNDKELDIVARNAILLLTALRFDPESAAEIMVHIWYSALIPQPLLLCLRENLLPLLEDVRSKIRAKPFNGLFSRTWIFGSRTLQLVLRRDQWVSLPSYLDVPKGLSASKAHQVRMASTMAPERKDYLERALCAQLPGWRVSKMDFRMNGILLPFGSSKKLFDTPNPLVQATLKEIKH